MPFNTSMPVLYYNKSMFVEQIIASSGELYCSPENGRGEEHASEFSFDNEAAVEFLSWWAQMVHDGMAGNTGRDTTDAQNAFKSGAIGITLESTGALGGMQEAAEEQDFDLGVGYFPRLEDNEFGPIIGGASLGHFPVSRAALEEPEDVQWREEYPQFDVAVQQLEDTALSTPTQGCAVGVMPQARKAVEEALEAILQGGDTQEELTAAVEDLQGQLDDYNSTVE